MDVISPAFFSNESGETHMNRFILLALGVIVALAALAATLQHMHYQTVRRTAAQDRQPVFYGSETFHVVTFVRLREDDDLIDALKALRSADPEATWIYAGKVVVNVPSEQIGPVEWSGVVLAQYASQAAYEAARAASPFQAALDRFPEHYEQGMRRNSMANLLLPQTLLVRKAMRAARFTQSPYPFTPAAAELLPERGQEMIDRLRSANDLGQHAAVVINLQRRGTPEQEANDAQYVSPMVGLMAERGYGPIHIGDAATPPGAHDFDRVAIVYYPGTDYFADMFGSTFYQSILSDKQLGDNQSTITVPVLTYLQE